MTVTETREYRIECSRQITDDCLISTFTRSYDKDDGKPRSVTAAEEHFREEGWMLHTDGRASCPECMTAWNTPPEEPTNEA